MAISHFLTAATVFLTGLLPSCHKTTAAKPAAAPTVATATVATNSALHDLGELSLTNHFETCVQLGQGKHCTLTPHMVDSRNVELTVALESRTAAGKTRDLTVTQVTAKTGKPLEIALGDYQISFTPKIEN